MAQFEGKTILVTGACGTVGFELIRQLLHDPKNNPAEVIGLDNQETALFFQDQSYLQDSRASFFIADIRDRDELARRMEGVNIVFHTAALKHVVLCERSPDQALNTNILGVQNIIATAQQAQVETVIFTSSDKAVNPTNVMGTSKLMGERLMTAANSTQRAGRGPVFASTRFGNVLGSSGSVIPIFHNQIYNGGPVTLTDSEMTRFIMSVEQSVSLVIDSALEAQGGEVFITKMPVVNIENLADAMINKLSLRYGYPPSTLSKKIIGSKPGEKLYEELMSEEETRRAVELNNFFSVLPAFRGLYKEINYDYPSVVSKKVDDPYISNRQTPLTISETEEFLSQHNLLTTPDKDSTQRYWPGDKQ